MFDVPLRPWMRGPFELIKHADGHLKDGKDIDRRLALIGFDNAIEVCIDVFVQLHPSLRGRYDITNDEKEKALRNYHTKIEFLDRYVAKQNIHLDVVVEAVVWYHSLRNELYHSGNGMVPEMHALEGARDAALSTFRALFGVDAAPLLGDVRRDRSTMVRVPFSGVNDQMGFLPVFIEFEEKLQAALAMLDPAYDKRSGSGLIGAWRRYTSLNRGAARWDPTVTSAINLRNATVHGDKTTASDEEIVALALELMDIADALEPGNQKTRTRAEPSDMASALPR